MTSALDGIRVLDLSRLLPGPFATQLLADFGADVIKVEEPGRGDYLRGFAPLREGESLFFLNLNRSKRSVALDVRHPEGREAFLALVETADVLVESFRPGVMEGAGLGPEALVERNPGLVYCSLTGYGKEGPLADRAGHDLNYLAMAGFLDLLRDSKGVPVIPGVQIADVGGGGLNACLGILLALLARERTGAGQVVDAAMVDGLAPWLVYRWAMESSPGGLGPYLSGEFPCYSVFKAADGRFVAVGALEPKFWRRLCEHLRRPEWVPLQFAEGAEREKLRGEMKELFQSRTRDEWVTEFGPVDCCVTPVLELGELERNVHWKERGLVQEFLDPERGILRLLGPPVRLTGTPARPPAPPPRLGQHTEQVLREVGVSSGQFRRLLRCGAAG